jgi:hypothetical protein
MIGGASLSDITDNIPTPTEALESARRAAAAAEMQARLTAEYGTLRGYFLPVSFVNWYQGQRALLGFEPPTASQMPILLALIPITIGILLTRGYALIVGSSSQFMKGVHGKLTSTLDDIEFILICLFLMVLFIFLIFYYFGPSTRVKKDLIANQKSIGSIYLGFQNQDAPVPDSSYKLINIQPLSIKQIGFVGPNEDDGIFNPALGIQTALRSGANFFTFQIDYLEVEKNSRDFDKAEVPTLVYRNGSGQLISSNGATIKESAQQLANYVFSEDLGASEYPIIVYLHFVRTPDPIRNPDGYLKFLKTVAEGLAPIQPFILKTAKENFSRQKSEASLLQLSLPTISKSMILLSNADTSIFRNTQATGSAVSVTSDLDSFVNMRVYLENPTDKLGVTQPSSGSNAHAVIMPFERLKAMSESEKAAFAMKGKTRFVIAMPAPLENPSYSEIKSLLNDTGVNAIPLNLIGEDTAAINKIVGLWTESKPFYMLKQMMLQSYTTTVSPYS